MIKRPSTPLEPTPLPPRANRSTPRCRPGRARAAALALALSGAWTPAWAQAAPPTDKSPLFKFAEREPARPAEDAAAQTRAVQALVATLHDIKLDASERREAAIRLIRLATPPAVAAICRELSYAPATPGSAAPAKPAADPAPAVPATNGTADAAAQRIMVQALGISTDFPPIEATPLLAELLERAEEPLLSETAAALARCLDHPMTQQTLAIALDPNAPAIRRRGAILTLGKLSSQNAAKALMQLIAATQPEYIRGWAFDALADLSGITDFADDLTRWQQWWDQHRWLELTQWTAHLNDNFVRRNLRAKQAIDAINEKVLELQRRLYRATAQADRAPLLVAMLGDALLATRQLGMELAIERSLLDSQTPSQELRAAIHARIDDTSPALREQAAGLIMNLKDDAGADAVAERLEQLGESQPQVLRSYLRVMKRMPRRTVVARCIDLLDDPVLRPEAAGALARALEKNLLTDEQRRTLKTTVHEQLPPPQPGTIDAPDPAMIELLGRLADDTDWPRIEAWLASTSDAVRTPAAIAWAASSQPLDVLINEANDVSLQRIAIEAAASRGNDAPAYLALAARKPAQEQLAQAWLRAMEAMAARVGPDVVLRGDERLTDRKEPWTVRDSLLSIAIEKLLPPARPTTAATTSQPAPITLSPVLHTMLVTRGELRFEHGEATQAAGDFRLVLDSAPLKDAPLLNRAEVGLLQSYLAQGEVDAALRAVNASLAARAVPAEAQTKMFAALLDAARRSLAASQSDAARRLLLESRKLFRPPPTEFLAQKLADLEKQAGVEPAEPTTQPTTQPSR